MIPYGFDATPAGREASIAFGRRDRRRVARSFKPRLGAPLQPQVQGRHDRACRRLKGATETQSPFAESIFPRPSVVPHKIAYLARYSYCMPNKMARYSVARQIKRLLMPKVIPTEEIEQIAEVVGRFPDGAGLDEIGAAMGEGLSRRTLQRRLADLIAQGRVVGRREWRAFKYRSAAIAGAPGITEGYDRVQERVEVYVPTSPEGAEIKAYVRRPLQERRPVGYRIAFLDSYRPNETWYLPDPLRVQLHSLGRSPGEQMPAGTSPATF